MGFGKDGGRSFYQLSNFVRSGARNKENVSLVTLRTFEGRYQSQPVAYGKGSAGTQEFRRCCLKF